MENFIRIYDNALTPDLCQELIDIYEEQSKHVVEFTDSAAKFDYIDLASIGLVDVSNALIQHSVPYLNDYLKQTGLDPYIKINAVEGMKLKKYKKHSQDKIGPHYDCWNKDTAPRFMQFLYYLNDNNGYTTFPLMDFKNKPKQGTLILFPPYFTHLHTAENPTDFDKYIVNSSLRFC